MALHLLQPREQLFIHKLVASLEVGTLLWFSFHLHIRKEFLLKSLISLLLPYIRLKAQKANGFLKFQICKHLPKFACEQVTSGIYILIYRRVLCFTV